MDTQLVFPAPRVADPPPPLDKLLVDLLDNTDLAEVIITNPLTIQNIPDSLEARTTIHSLARVRQALATPFNTPDRCFEREDWMKLILEVLACIHGGLRACQLASPEGLGRVADAFHDLTTTEEAIASRSREIIEGLAGFFWIDSDDAEDIIKYHCFRCVQTAGIKPKSNDELLKSIQLNTALDTRKLRETLLNEAVRETHKEVDEWRKKQRDLLISFITETITTDKEITAEKLADAVYHLSPEYLTWVAKYQDRMRAYIRQSIGKTVCEDTTQAQASRSRVNHRTSRTVASAVQMTAPLLLSFRRPMILLACLRYSFQTCCVIRE
jgi:hypothetical protein